MVQNIRFFKYAAYYIFNVVPTVTILRNMSVTNTFMLLQTSDDVKMFFKNLETEDGI